MLRKFTLPVDRLYCVECARSLGVVMGSMKGVMTAKVSFQTGVIAGLHDDAVVGILQMIKKIESLGYRVPDSSPYE